MLPAGGPFVRGSARRSALRPARGASQPQSIVVPLPRNPPDQTPILQESVQGDSPTVTKTITCVSTGHEADTPPPSAASHAVRRTVASPDRLCGQRDAARLNFQISYDFLEPRGRRRRPAYLRFPPGAGSF